MLPCRTVMFLIVVAAWTLASAAEPLTRVQVIGLIKARVPDEIVAAEILERGTDATVDDELIEAMRRAGAGRSSLAALDRIRPRSEIKVTGAPGTVLRLDGRFIGQVGADGTFTLNGLKPGEHELSAELRDHIAFKRSVHLQANKETEVQIEMNSVFGSLNITTNASNATIHVEGVGVFRNEITERKVRVGTYSVRVDAPFRDQHNETIEIKSGESLTKRIVLSPDRTKLAELFSRARQNISGANYQAAVRDLRSYIDAADEDSLARERVLAQAYLAVSELQVRDYANSRLSAERALAAGASLPYSVFHHHTGLAFLKPHAARLVLSASEIRYEPGGVCNFGSFAINASGVRVSNMKLADGSIAVRLQFQNPNKHEKTITLNFVDPDSRRLEVIGSLLSTVTIGSFRP